MRGVEAPRELNGEIERGANVINANLAYPVFKRATVDVLGEHREAATDRANKVCRHDVRVRGEIDPTLNLFEKRFTRRRRVNDGALHGEELPAAPPLRQEHVAHSSATEH